MNKKITILFTSLLIFFSACENSSVDSEKISLENEDKSPQKHNSKSNENHDLLKNMGFDFQGEKVEIDINQTDQFFKQIEIEMHSKAKKIEQKIKNAEINFTKGIGIEIEDNKIGIDLNRTRNMLQGINSLIKDIVLDSNYSTN